ncbi:MAG TPA: type IX secretion system membrane protein PorP/SprF [Bacteroidia bacterium]|nr:type IX secretion system membrane protein PorP/SprF [Bacteroidia bacterium]
MLTLFGLMLSVILKAQDPQFTQFYAAPMYLNPAFTGVTYEHRFVANYRNQWPGISKTYQTYMASYDYNLSDLNSGLGINVMQDRAGTAGLTHTQFGINYAYHFKVSKFSEIRLGANLNYNMKRLDFNKLKFNDQISTGSSVSLDAANYERLNFMDFAAGALLNSTEYWLGLSAKHLTQPNSSLVGDRVPLPLTISLHGGYRFIIEQKSKELKRYVSPAFNYRHQQKYDQLDIGVYYYHLPINVGLWYRGLPLKKYAPTYTSSESIAVLLGFDITDYNLRVGYSYDLTISKLGVANSLGAHEISLIYEVAKKKKRNKRILVSCPKF